MPLHSFICPDQHRFDAFQSLAELREFEPCIFPGCAHLAQKHFLRFPFATISPDVHYESPVDGRVINSKHARLEDMARHNCVEYDPAMKQDHMRRIKASDDTIAKKIDRHFDAEIDAMPTRKRELLEQELRSGADLEFTRGTA